MQLQFTTTDVFTETRYVGNPLAVVRVPASLRSQLTENQKQRIAREFNYSETTFLHEPTVGSDTADFDIFTPKSRITFAGHPTIGTAIYVAQNASTYPGVKNLRTIAGTISLEYNECTGQATVGVPHDFRIHQKKLAHPFGDNERSGTSSATVPIASIVKGMAFGLCQLKSLEDLATRSGPLVPSEDRFKPELCLDVGSGWDIGYTGTFYYVNLGHDGNVRKLRTRSIPQHEDPGTGSASAALCCFQAVTEGAKGLTSFHLTQGVEMGRQCDIFVEVTMHDDGKTIADVRLSGTAVSVMEGTLTV